MATVAKEPNSASTAMDDPLERVLWRSSTFEANSYSKQTLQPSRLQRSSSHGLLRRRPRLQLPSFERLGISAYTSNLSRFDRQDSQQQPRPLSARPATEMAFHRSDPSSMFQNALPFLGSAPLLTPPDDINSIKWNKAVALGNENGSPVQQSPVAYEGVERLGISAAATDRQASAQECQPLQSSAEKTKYGQLASDTGLSEPTAEQPQNFLELGIGANISSVTTPDARTNGVTVISQTLPHPIQDSNPHSAFTPLVKAIQSRFEGREGQRPPYIRITHAVPPQFTLRNLPSSPPSTPSRQTEEDYFSLNVFSNAAPVRTYHLFDGSVDRSAPPSPAPIVPPSTVQVALVERYIPPSTVEEHDAFFSVQGPSVLIDRLVELSAGSGSLMLIYPTKVGGQTFRSDHVGPVLDSFLRTMVVVNDMSSDLASSLGRISSISGMLSFEEMKEKVARLCRHLSRPRSSASFNSEYSLVYADVGEVPLDRSTWSEWFLQQETPRMKAILKSYWQRGQKLPTSKDTVIPATLLRDLKNCVEGGKYEDGEPTSKIEVGVFVIRRTR